MKLQMTTKRIQIDKAQSTMLIVTVVATIITVFCLVSAKTLLNQATYQKHVIAARRAAADQMEANVTNATNLSEQYTKVFEGGTTNVIGGKNASNANSMPPDGDNGTIVLDALPKTYDFPALLTSISNLLGQDGIGSPTIGGSDQITTVDNQPSSNPQPTNIDLTLSGTASYADVQKVVKDLERSIRPFDITNLTLNGSNSSMTLSLNMTTYYQPAKTLNLNTKEVH